jgi:hypothetical protein
VAEILSGVDLPDRSIAQPPDRLWRRVVGLVALVACALCVIPAAAQAALPRTGASFSFADHTTAGANWHVEFTVDGSKRSKLATLIVYSEQCHATVVKRGVPISAAGVVAASGGLLGGGTWAVSATFNAADSIVGTMRMTRADCDTGLLDFPNAATGDGTSGHEHGDKYADFASATLKERRQAQALQRSVLKNWGGVTLAEAHRRGFHRNRAAGRGVGNVFHVYNKRNELDGRTFDGRRPESLVFWRTTSGTALLLGPMFRVPPGGRPSFAGPIPIYHHHQSRSGRIVSEMTHLWMVKGRKAAWAFCLPTKQLAAYNPRFKYLPGYSNHEHIGAPCPE